MKKLFLACSVAIVLASCTTSFKTATVNSVSNSVVSVTTADLQVSSKKISYTYYPNATVRRGGYKNIKATAISEALRANGGGDVLVECQEATTKYTGLFGKKIKSITVSGYPATYTNFKAADPKSFEHVSNSTSKISPKVSIF